jgi:hypothetical protein
MRKFLLSLSSVLTLFILTLTRSARIGGYNASRACNPIR